MRVENGFGGEWSEDQMDEDSSDEGSDDNEGSEDNDEGSDDNDGGSNDNDGEATVENPFFGAGSESDDSSEEDADSGEDSGGDLSDKEGAGDNLSDGSNDDVSDMDGSDSSLTDDSDSDADSDEETAEKEDEKVEDAGTDEDAFINMLKAAREKKVREAPPDIKLKQTVTDLSFHPEEDILAVSNIQGEISLFRYSNEENKIEKKLKLHKGGIRCLDYSLDGRKILTGGKDKFVKVYDVCGGKVETDFVMSHPSALYSVVALQHGAVSGDEDGTLKLWDFRKKKSILTSKRFDEHISSILAEEDKYRIIAASGEGTIQSWDLRMNKADMQSEVYGSEQNCLATVRGDSKLLVGDSAGTLRVFNEGQYGYHSDLYRGHPDSINCMVAVTDKVLITGCEDGILRAVHIFPNRFIGQVGDHDGNLPIEKMDVNGAGHLIASIGHDNKVKFWNISYLEQMDYNKKRKPILPKVGTQKRRKMLQQAVDKEKEHALPSCGRQNKADFFKEIDS